MRTFLSGVLAITLLLVVSVSISSGQMLCACKNNDSGIIRLVDCPGECRSNEVLVTWNIQGPQGEQGTQGEPGPTGPQGTPGTDGQPGQLDPTRVYYRTETVSNVHGYVHAVCDDPNDIVLSASCSPHECRLTLCSIDQEPCSWYFGEELCQQLLGDAGANVMSGVARGDAITGDCSICTTGCGNAPEVTVACYQVD